MLADVQICLSIAAVTRVKPIKFCPRDDQKNVLETGIARVCFSQTSVAFVEDSAVVHQSAPIKRVSGNARCLEDDSLRSKRFCRLFQTFEAFFNLRELTAERFSVECPQRNH